MAGLTPRQKKFCDEYMLCGNATQAAIRAGYSDKYAGQNADKILKNTNVKEYLAYFQQKVEQKAIKSVEEVQQWWSSIMDNADESTKDRLKASELLVKSKGGFMDHLQVKGSLNNPFEGLTTEELRKLAGDD